MKQKHETKVNMRYLKILRRIFSILLTFIMLFVCWRHYEYLNIEVTKKQSTQRRENLRTTTEEIHEENFDQILQQNVTKIIILSSTPRSGSSFISEILSSSPLTSLWTEPLRFLYEKPPKFELRKIKNLKKALNKTKEVKDKRYRIKVPKAEKLKLIDDFMNCKFEDYQDFLASQVSRQFIFKLPYFALGRPKVQFYSKCSQNAAKCSQNAV